MNEFLNFIMENWLGAVLALSLVFFYFKSSKEERKEILNALIFVFKNNETKKIIQEEKVEEKVEAETETSEEE